MPKLRASAFLGLVPFVVAAAVYTVAAAHRHALYPDDPLLPLPEQLWNCFLSVFSFTAPDPLADIWRDTGASVSRLLLSLGVSGSSALVLAISMQEIKWLRCMISPSLVTVAKI